MGANQQIAAVGALFYLCRAAFLSIVPATLFDYLFLLALIALAATPDKSGPLRPA
jgi:hypothetical protein